MDLNLKGKKALITASTGGIGFEIARCLAREGATVVINGRNNETVTKAEASIRSEISDAKLELLVADNATSEGFEKTVAAYPDLDILINNLGIYESVDFFDTTDLQWQRLFDVNIQSCVRLSRYYLKNMIEKDSGRIIFISSESGISPAPEMAHYSATKLMQLGISRALTELTKGSKVTVNAVLPGSTRTEGVEKFIMDLFPGMDYEDAEKKFMKENRTSSLIGRLIRPAEVAALVAFVSSPLASAINGAALRVDGGLIRRAV